MRTIAALVSGYILWTALWLGGNVGLRQTRVEDFLTATKTNGQVIVFVLHTSFASPRSRADLHMH